MRGVDPSLRAGSARWGSLTSLAPAATDGPGAGISFEAGVDGWGGGFVVVVGIFTSGGAWALLGLLVGFCVG